MKRREDLTTPRQNRRLGVHYDPDAFGELAERFAALVSVLAGREVGSSRLPETSTDAGADPS